MILIITLVAWSRTAVADTHVDWLFGRYWCSVPISPINGRITRRFFLKEGAGSVEIYERDASSGRYGVLESRQTSWTLYGDDRIFVTVNQEAGRSTQYILAPKFDSIDILRIGRSWNLPCDGGIEDIFTTPRFKWMVENYTVPTQEMLASTTWCSVFENPFDGYEERTFSMSGNTSLAWYRVREGHKRYRVKFVGTYRLSSDARRIAVNTGNYQDWPIAMNKVEPYLFLNNNQFQPCTSE